MKITTELPSGFILLCIIIGALYAFLLYQKDLKKRDSSRSVWANRLLFSTRFLSASLLCVLLLNPLLKYLQREIEKPVVFLTIDNSQSMLMSADSASTRATLLSSIGEIETRLEEKYDVYTVVTGERPRTGEAADFGDQSSDLDASFREMELMYGGQNLIANILLSDGIYNRGMNPLFDNKAIATPLYSIGIGDTTIRKDVRIYDAKANTITFLGNTFPTEVVINADKCDGQVLELGLYENGTKLAGSSMKVNGDRFSGTHTFITKASEVGSHRYQVRVSSVNGEANIRNNFRWVYTEVLDGRQKVALVSHAPHPDLAAIKSMIESNDQYEVAMFLDKLPTINKGDYDLVITHQMPLNSSDFNWITHLKELKVPVFMVIGSQTEINFFNRLNLGVKITGNRANYNQSLANLQKTFSLFDLSESIPSFLKNCPPLLVPFGEYSTSSPSSILFKQRIGQVDTDMPLLYYQEENGYRSGLLMGEGIWRWKMYDFETHENFDIVNELLSRSVQYLSLKDDKRKFRMYTSSKLFAENEMVSFFADVYNDSYEFTADADVRLQLTNEKGDEFSYALNPINGLYKHKIGSLPAGKYTFKGSAFYNGKTETASGSFSVRKLELESMNLSADFSWMRQLSTQSGGGFYSIDKLNTLIEDLLSREDAQAMSHSSFTMKDVIDQKWIFVLIFLLLGTEWFIRRWLGGY